jgi:hypothetical protein
MIKPHHCVAIVDISTISTSSDSQPTTHTSICLPSTSFIAERHRKRNTSGRRTSLLSRAFGHSIPHTLLIISQLPHSEKDIRTGGHRPENFHFLTTWDFETQEHGASSLTQIIAVNISVGGVA